MPASLRGRLIIRDTRDSDEVRLGRPTVLECLNGPDAVYSWVGNPPGCFRADQVGPSVWWSVGRTEIEMTGNPYLMSIRYLPKHKPCIHKWKEFLSN